LNKIILAKRNSVIFLATLLVLGTIVTILPSAQAQPYYEDTYEPDYQSYSQDYEIKYPSYQNNNYYKSKDSSNSVSLSKIDCNNINYNNNGVDVSLGVPNDNNVIDEAQVAEDEGQDITTNGWGYGERNGYKQNDNDFKFVCINNNDNNVIVVNETTPIPPTATLTVIKQITCEDETEGDCEDLLELITEDDFRFQVEGNNPDPSTTFPGSLTGTVVTLGPGDFNVTEIISEEELEDVLTFFETHPDSTSLTRNALFSGDCTFSEGFFNNGDTFLVANGTIAAGELQTCIATNAYEIFGSSSSTPIIAQGTEDSSPASELTTLAKQPEDSVELTALEKVAKLKQQWLDLLP
jgi:hypothetical protein